MRGDIPEAAFRLLTALPVRKHERKERQKKEYVKSPRPQGTAKPILYKGETFKSHSDAMAKLRIGHGRLLALISSGTATYAE